MKRIKSMGLSICALVIAAMIFFSGGANLFALASVRAEDTASNLFIGSVQTTVELGDHFDVPQANGAVIIAVKAPNGQPVEPVDNKIYAGQLGNYKVEVKSTEDSSTDYSYNVYCSMNYSWSVYVDYNGATIPTFMGTNDSFVVPNVFLGRTGDNGEIVEYEVPAGMERDINGFDVTVSGAAAKKSVQDGKLTITAEAHGTMILKYSMDLFGSKFYSKEYKITVQQDFVNDTTPRLSVVNVPSSANVNTKVTLPIATATSSYDERVFVKVTVTHNGNEVIKVNPENIDEQTGYYVKDASNPESGEKVIFDNVRNMSFYPTELGTYRVTYQAIDTAGNKSVEYFYNIECTDGLAPVYVDFDRSEIPVKWGLSVTNDNGKLEDTSINIPFPDVRDNADGDDALTLTVRIIDPESKTVLRFTNAFHATSAQAGTGKEGHIAKNTLYDAGADQLFTEDGFRFDFNKYNVTTKTGAYTIEYRVSDSKGKTRTYSPSITVEVVSDFEDTKAPQIDPIDTVKYVLLGVNGDKSLVIPAPMVNDDNDAYPNVEYTISFRDYEGAATDPVSLDDAGTLDIVEVKEGDSFKYFLQNDEGFDLEISEGYLDITCVATDDAGNTSETREATIAVYLATNKGQSGLSFHQSFTTDADALDRVNINNGSESYKSEINLGNFRIEGANDVMFAGFEIVLKNPENAIVPVSLERLIVDNTIYIKNISFAPKMTGEHDLYVRVFDINGSSQLYKHTFEITGQIENDDPFAKAVSATIPTTGASINTRYSLKNIPNGTSTSTYAVLRVSGNSFSLIGNDFIANSVGAYTFKDYTIAANLCDEFNDYAYDQAKLNHRETYTTTVNASANPVIEFLGVMPSYSPKHSDIVTGDRFNNTDINKYVVLPSVTAFNNDGNAVIEIKITDRDSRDVSAYKLFQKEVGDSIEYKFFKDDQPTDGYYFANVWAFAPQNDGAYTITYTATVNNVNKATSTHTVLVGKITGPVLTLNQSTRNSYAINSEFKFFTISSVVDADVNGNALETKSYTYVRKLIDPSNNTVVTVSGTVDNQGSKQDNNGEKIVLDKSGTYTEIYEVTDLYGNKTTLKFQFQVAAQSRGVTAPMKMLSAILIIVTSLLLIGVIIYVVRFRSVRKIKK